MRVRELIERLQEIPERDWDLVVAARIDGGERAMPVLDTRLRHASLRHNQFAPTDFDDEQPVIILDVSAEGGFNESR